MRFFFLKQHVFCCLVVCFFYEDSCSKGMLCVLEIPALKADFPHFVVVDFFFFLRSYVDPSI